MQHGQSWSGLLRVLAIVALMGSAALISCTTTGSTTGNVNGTVSLTAMNAAAVGGLTFAFPDGTLFGFPGQSATLALGTDGMTFTLTTSRGLVLNGTITFGSCTFTQNPASLAPGGTLFTQKYDTCQVTGKSDGDIGFGGAGHGILLLSLGSAGATPVSSDPLGVTYTIDMAGQITINVNTTPIGVTG
jgi:hypothetical protein